MGRSGKKEKGTAATPVLRVWLKRDGEAPPDQLEAWRSLWAKLLTPTLATTAPKETDQHQS